MIVYMTLVGNTKKYVAKVDSPSVELTVENSVDLVIEEPYLIVIPTYNDETTDLFWDFLENETNRKNCKGIFGAGNRNFAQLFCYSAKDLGRDFDIPVLHMLEFQGSAYDIQRLEEELEKIG